MTNSTDFKTEKLKVKVNVSYVEIFSEMKNVPPSMIFGVQLPWYPSSNMDGVTA